MKGHPWNPSIQEAKTEGSLPCEACLSYTATFCLLSQNKTKQNKQTHKAEWGSIFL